MERTPNNRLSKLLLRSILGVGAILLTAVSGAFFNVRLTPRPDLIATAVFSELPELPPTSLDSVTRDSTLAATLRDRTADDLFFLRQMRAAWKVTVLNEGNQPATNVRIKIPRARHITIVHEDLSRRVVTRELLEDNALIPVEPAIAPGQAITIIGLADSHSASEHVEVLHDRGDASVTEILPQRRQGWDRIPGWVHFITYSGFALLSSLVILFVVVIGSGGSSRHRVITAYERAIRDVESERQALRQGRVVRILSITRNELLQQLLQIGAPHDVRNYTWIEAARDGDVLPQVQFDDGTSITLEHSRTMTDGTLNVGWDVKTRRLAYAYFRET